MKSILLIVLAFSTLGMAEDKSKDFYHHQNLFICTEKAQMLCKFLNFEFKQAQQEVREICGITDNSEVHLQPVWNDQGEVTSFECMLPPPTNQSCKELGLDCMLEGQCVRDKAPRPGSSSHPDWGQAIGDIDQNPSDISNYPHLFYLCR